MTPYLLVVFTNNLEQNRAFYESLGLSFESAKHGDDPEHFSTKLGDMVFELYPCAEQEKISHFRIGLQATFTDEQKSTVIAQSLSHQQFDNGQHYCVLQDPDGRDVELVF